MNSTKNESQTKNKQQQGKSADEKESQVLKMIESFKDKDEITIEQMLKKGVHLGHKKGKWNPKMRDFILTVKQGIHIIDLNKTKKSLEEATDFLKSKLAGGNKQVLFVSTKRETRDLVTQIAQYCQMPYVVERWIGGVLTNFKTIRRRVEKLMAIEELQEKGELKKYTKKEQAAFKEKIEKFNKKMGGIKNMKGLPEVVIVVDLVADELALKEAKRMNIPVVAIVDTNADPEKVDHAIVANDDALSSLRLILSFIASKIKNF
ncbi:MAG: 30S ribosomal protein S2 [Candidatus Moranbacteria bacterium]|nr:30S ribosomal protein S2 [Candidatus Moranbacteria bacterium]